MKYVAVFFLKFDIKVGKLSNKESYSEQCQLTKCDKGMYEVFSKNS